MINHKKNHDLSTTFRSKLVKWPAHTGPRHGPAAPVDRTMAGNWHLPPGQAGQVRSGHGETVKRWNHNCLVVDPDQNGGLMGYDGGFFWDLMGYDGGFFWDLMGYDGGFFLDLMGYDGGFFWDLMGYDGGFFWDLMGYDGVFFGI